MSEKFGKFTLLRQIAVGGMGEIFLAQERGFGGVERSLVVKRLLPTLTSNEEFVTMFLDEGRIAAQLSHPNIVQLYDVGEVDGKYFIAMEYVDGLSLAELLIRISRAGQPALPLEAALPIAHSLAAALSYAHSRRDARGESLCVVHRDVTPQNVLLSRLGGVKLTDFGIATAANKVHVTVVGRVKGKLAYMAPEQARGEKVDPRADLFALGILMYEMTVGVHPFLDATHVGGDEPDAVQALVKIITSPPPPPSHHDPGYPTDLQALVMRCLEKDPSNRPGSAAEVEHSLEDLIALRHLNASGRALASLIREVCPPTDRPATMSSALVLARPGQGTIPMATAADESGSKPIDLPTSDQEASQAPLGATHHTAYRARRSQARVLLIAFAAALGGAGLMLTAHRILRQPEVIATEIPPLPPPDMVFTEREAQHTDDLVDVASQPDERATDLAQEASDTGQQASDLARDRGQEASDEQDWPRGLPPPSPRRRGYIAFQVSPWAYVQIDGRSFGQAPRLPVAVSAGRHRVTLRCQRETYTTTVHVAPGGRSGVQHAFPNCR